MSRSHASRFGWSVALGALLMLQAACGGGDGIGSGGTGILSGAVVKGPVANASVVAYAVSAGQPGPQLGSAVTDANGNFSMTIGSYTGPLLLQAGAGSYRDEATGNIMGMATGDVMTAAIDSAAGPGEIQITPVTSMAQARAQQMAGGMTDANIASANAALGNYFSVGDILHVRPMNPLVPGSGANANTDARNYGMGLAAMSQYALSQSMTNSASLVTSMMSDASDGRMDGRNGAGPIRMNMGGIMSTSTMQPNAGSNGLAAAMTNFAMSPANLSGLTASDVAPLVQKMSGSGGRF